MSNLVASVRAQLDNRCVTRRETLRKQACSVSLAKMPGTRVVADLDEPGAPLGQHETRCDYLVFAEADDEHPITWVVPLELKARLEIRKVAAQLQAGADAAGKLVADALEVGFVPVVACRLKKGQTKWLKGPKMRVRFKNRKSETFRVMGCGGKLVDYIR